MKYCFMRLITFFFFVFTGTTIYADMHSISLETSTQVNINPPPVVTPTQTITLNSIQNNTTMPLSVRVPQGEKVSVDPNSTANPQSSFTIATNGLAFIKVIGTLPDGDMHLYSITLNNQNSMIGGVPYDNSISNSFTLDIIIDGENFENCSASLVLNS